MNYSSLSRRRCDQRQPSSCKMKFCKKTIHCKQLCSSYHASAALFLPAGSIHHLLQQNNPECQLVSSACNVLFQPLCFSPVRNPHLHKQWRAAHHKWPGLQQKGPRQHCGPRPAIQRAQRYRGCVIAGATQYLPRTDKLINKSWFWHAKGSRVALKTKHTQFRLLLRFLWQP